MVEKAPENIKNESEKVVKKVDDEKAVDNNELSDEDEALKQELELCVKILTEPNVDLYKNALECIRSRIRSSTTSMTSVPKPLKFMRPYYDVLKLVHQKIKDCNTQQLCADILSVLAMTTGDAQDCIKFRIIGTPKSAGDWGHEYIRHLCGELVTEWELAMDETEHYIDLISGLEELMKEIVPFCMSHNAETEICDLLVEVEHLDFLDPFIDENSYSRVCLYLASCAPYVGTVDAKYLLRTVVRFYWKFHEYPNAIRYALQLNDRRLVQEIFESCSDPSIRRQLAFILVRQQFMPAIYPSYTEEYDEMFEILSNSHLNGHFLSMARELDIMEPKAPEEIYKTYLETTRSSFLSSGQVDSARQNLASSFVNGFVNCGFGRDKLLAEDGNKWLFKNKEHGMFSAAASLGLILLWDIDGGLTRIDKYLYSSEDYIKAGTLLACGILNTSVQSECDPSLALLSDYVLYNSTIMRIGAIAGLGLAYAGTNNEATLHVILPALTDPKSNMEVIGVASLACGLITVGTANAEFTAAIMEVLMGKKEADLKDTFARFLAVGLALCHFGQKDSITTIKEAVSFVSEPFKSMLQGLLDGCAYAGTGHVLKVQEFLHTCSEHSETTNKSSEKSDSAPTSSASSSTIASSSSPTSSAEKSKETKDKEKEKLKEKDKEDKEKDLFSKQAVAVIGIALISMGEEIGSDMVFRHFGHLIRYCEPPVRRAVPLALGLISISNPKLSIVETLGKFSHDSDQEVAYNAIFAMGLVGAGTNNSRLSAMLRQLAQFYAKDPNCLFMVRIAQGLTHMGKGTLTLSPYHSDRQLLNPIAIAGIIATIVAFLDVKNIILGKSHYLLYMLTPAIQPRLLITLDEKLQPLPVAVRVGMAVDVVGQAGKPKTITGFQTHTTPVLLNYGERAELATDQYISLTPVLEGMVILKKNPNFDGFVNFEK